MSIKLGNIQINLLKDIVNLNKVYIGSNLIYSAIPVSSSDDAQAFISASGISGSEATAITNLVAGLKSNGTWDKYNAIYPMVGGTADSHKWNLKDPRDLDAAYRITFNGTWTHDANGAKGDGSTAWGQTWFYDSALTFSGGAVDLKLAYYSNLDIAGSTTSNTEIGNRTTDTEEALLQVNDTFGMWGRLYTATAANGGSADTNARYVVFNASGSIVTKYENGIASGSTQTQTVAAASGIPFALNSATSTTNGLTDVTNNRSPRRCAYAAIGIGFSATEIEDDYTVIQAYQTALSRQV